MLIDEVVTELLLRWEEKPSLTPEELCHEHEDSPEYPALLEVVQQEILHLQAADSFLANSQEENSDPQAMPPAQHPPSEPRSSPDTSMHWTAPGLRYRPLSFHAKGGLGEVFRAEDEELHREVALKRIQERHRDNPESQRRFLREAKITAKLQHPGIVPVHGLGKDDQGRPCYAMRFIEGSTLGEAIKRFHEAERQSSRDPAERSLALRELLHRFIAVCNTVAYAHSRGILHRDLKPGNILLGDYGETLLVDWGLAKSFVRTEVDRPRGQATLMPAADGPTEGTTLLGHAMGTPGYMSPEQAEGRWDVVGPASDIFSLGATLYALLTGQAPYRGHNSEVALFKARQHEFLPLRQVKRDVPRALEAICLKAMASDPEQRYRTAKDLAADVEQWLADQPVTAYREPLQARLGRWARRHKPAVAAVATMVLTALLVGMGGLAAGMRAVKAEQRNTETALEQVTAEQEKTQAALVDTTTVLGFFKDKVLAASRPLNQDGGQGKDVSLREAVDKAEQDIAESFKDRPLLEASIRDTLGITYWYLGEPTSAIKQLDRALTLRTDQLGSDDSDTIESRDHLAHAYVYAGRIAEALRLWEQNLKLTNAKFGPDHLDTIESRNNLAEAYQLAGHNAEALRLFQQCLEQLEAKLGADDPKTLPYRNNLAVAYKYAGRTADALQLFEQNHKQMETHFGPEHPDTLASRDNLAGAYLDAGRSADAIPLLEQTLKQQEAKLGPDHLDTFITRNNLAEAYHALGRTTEAIHLHEENLKRQTTKLGNDHHDTLLSKHNLAVLYSAQGRYGLAEPLFKEALLGRTAKLGADHPNTLITMADLGLTLLRQKKYAEAEPTLRNCLVIRDKKQADLWTRFYTRSLLGEAFVGQKKYADAEPLLVQGYEGMKQWQDRIPPAYRQLRLTEALQRLVRLYEATGQKDKADAWRKKLKDAKKPNVKAAAKTP